MIDFNSIYVRTGKGEAEIASDSGALALDLYDALGQIDGKSTLAELSGKLPENSRNAFFAAVAQLEAQGYLSLPQAAAPERETPEPEAPASPEIDAQAGNKFAESKRNVIATVLFLDIVEYTKHDVASQLKIKEEFNALVSDLIRDVSEDDRVILDTGDGAALGFLGDPEDVLFIAVKLRDALKANDHRDHPDLHVRMGINLGPVRLVKDMTGRSNLIGDGVNDAQRVMSFAKGDQILVSRSFYDVVSRLSSDYAGLFLRQGVHFDKHRREHEVYEIGSAEKREAEPEEKKAAAMSEEEIQVERQEKLKAKLEAAAKAQSRVQQGEETARAARVETERKVKERAQQRHEERAVAVKLQKKRSGVGKLVAAVSFLLLVLLGGALPYIPFDSHIPEVEKLASDALKAPVTVKGLNIALLPSPRFLLKGVTVGNGMHVGEVAALTSLGGIFGGAKSFPEVKLNDASFDSDSVSMMSGWGAVEGVHADKISVSAAKLTLGETSLPAFDAEIAFAGAKVDHASIFTPDGKLKIDLAASGEDYSVSFSAKGWQAPLGPPVTWDELHAKGTAGRAGLRLDDVDGTLAGGQLQGSLHASWAGHWRAEGNFYGKGLDLATLTPVFSPVARLKGGLEIRANYAMQANRPEQLFASPQLNASFKVMDGEIGNADIAAAIERPGSSGGITKVGELTGAATLGAGAIQYRQLKLSSGLLQASGVLDVSSGQTLSGRIAVQLGQFSSTLGVSGSVGEPRFSR